jgi:hypothetical protein
VVAPTLVDETVGLMVRLLTVVPAGASVSLRSGADGRVEATMTSRSGEQRRLADELVLAGPVVPDSAVSIGGKAVAAAELRTGEVLRLPRGRTIWRYLEANASRFDRALENAARFDRAPFDPPPPRGGLGRGFQEAAVFGISRFTQLHDPVTTVYGPAVPPEGSGAELTLTWNGHAPGTFAVNLPLDLPPRLGARFNQDRFSKGADAPESFSGAVTEPPGDARDMVDLMEAASKLVHAARVGAVPLGWSPVSLPFRKPQHLTLGTKKRSAAIYVREEGVDGFIVITARGTGEFGNQIAVTARKSGPGAYDVTIQFEAGRFESARRAVAGRALGSSAQDLLEPGPVGILQAKAAGVRAEVFRGGSPATDTAPNEGRNRR